VWQVEQELCALLGCQHDAAPMALAGIEHHPIDDARSIKSVRAPNR
jgi:hypothetical protein